MILKDKKYRSLQKKEISERLKKQYQYERALTENIDDVTFI